MKDIVKVLGDNVKLLREKNGYSRSRLARETGVHLAWISKIEIGERTNGKQIAPSVIVLNKIATALHVRPEELLKSTSNKPEGITDNAILAEIKALLKKQNKSTKDLFTQVARRLLK